MEEINTLLLKLWDSYTQNNPVVKKVHDSFIKLNEKVVNDHIAFRTFNDPRMNIKVLAKIFTELGYQAMDTYYFEAKKLNAIHYEMPDRTDLPRIFISELILEEFSEEFNNIITKSLNSIQDTAYQDKNILINGSPWSKPSYKTYNRLREESEYGAWLYVFGFCANHFTVSINSLKKLNRIEKVNTHLKENGFILNNSGGEIKGSKEDLLQQSSIMADKVRIDFEEGQFEIPGCYYEFAIRYKDRDGKLYNGFIANNANKIFESTNYYKS